MQRSSSRTQAAAALFASCFVIACVLQTGWIPQYFPKTAVSTLQPIKKPTATASTKKVTPSAVRRSSEYSIEPKSCLLGDTNPEMVVFVSSRPKSLDMRASTRESWGYTAASCKTKVIFGFGRQQDKAIEKAFQVESLLHGDILQVSTVGDAYQNQTALVLAFFAWGLQHCRTKYMAKADDDVWLNFYFITPFLKAVNFTRFVSGVPFSAGNEVIRQADHLQRLSKDERPGNYYPAYMSGLFYVFPTLMIPTILQTAKTMKNYWIDDTFITGDVVEKMNQGLFSNSSDYVRHVGFDFVMPTPNFTGYDGCILWKRNTMHKIDAASKREFNNYPCAEKLKRCE